MNSLVWIPGILIVGLFVFLFFKRRKAVDFSPTDSAVEGTDAEREASEKTLRELPLDIRIKYLETMELGRRFSSRRGYSAESLETLLSKLRENGISCELYFQASGPLGYADSLLTPQGEFELFIERGKTNLAGRWIDDWERA